MNTRRWPDDYKDENNATLAAWKQRLAASGATIIGNMAVGRGVYVYGAVSLEHYPTLGSEDPFMTELTGAQKIQSIMDRMFEETMQDGHAGIWTGDEWRAAIMPLREEVPALKLILIDAQTDWTHDDWANAVIQVRETLAGEDKGETE